MLFEKTFARQRRRCYLEEMVSRHLSDSTNALLIPSSNPFATPEKLQTAVQKKSQTLKISGGHALTAATVALTRLDLPMLTCSAGRALATGIQDLYVRCPMPRAEAPILTSNSRYRTLGYGVFGCCAVGTQALFGPSPCGGSGFWTPAE